MNHYPAGRRAKYIGLTVGIVLVVTAIYLINFGHLVYVTVPTSSWVSFSGGFCFPRLPGRDFKTFNCYTVEEEPMLLNMRLDGIATQRIRVRPSETYAAF